MARSPVGEESTGARGHDQRRAKVTTQWATRAWWRLRAPDILGVLWVLGAAGAVMAPALSHGTSLGPSDLLSRYGLSQQSGVIAHNAQSTDQIAEMIPWTTLAWTQVHHGQLPLWNPYSALGLPLAFNWQSGVFGVPALLGYLAPLRLAYTVQVLATLALAGTGVYVFARVMRLGVMGAVMAATIYELSGTFMGFLGWPIGSVMAWAGWIFAATTLVLRGRHRLRAVAFLAVVGACAIYAGQPDALVVLGPSLVVFVAVVFLREQRGSEPRPVKRTAVDLVAAAVLGLGLSAPLLLPGLQLIPGSVFRNATRVNSAISLHSLTSLMLPGYSATSLAHSRFFSVGASDYVGVIAIVLAAMALVLRRQRPEVLAVGAVGVVMFALAFVPPVASVMNQLPFRARWHLGVVMVSFAVAVLAGVGVDLVVKSGQDWAVRTWVGAGFGISILVLAALWVVGRGTLTPPAAHQRADSFIWPAVQAGVGLAAYGLLSLGLRRPDRARWWAGAVLIGCETAFVAGVGASLWSSSPTFGAPTASEVSLAKAVGSSVVGFGARSCEAPPTIGILPEANALVGVRELSAYDPIIPQAYFPALHARPTIPVSAFCPVVRSAAVARLYGVGFVLVHHGQPRPVGGVYDQLVGDEDLYRIPGVALATLVSDGSPRTSPPLDAPGQAVAVTEPDPATRHLVTDAAGPTVLRLRLTDVPGWHATIDGKPLALDRFAGVLLQARIPAGRHVVVVSYLPTAFTIGIVLAAASAVGLAGSGLIGWTRRRRYRPDPPDPR